MKPPTPVLGLLAAALLLAGCAEQAPPADSAKSPSASTSDHHDHGGGGDAPPQPTAVTLGAPVSLSGEEFEVTYAVTKIDTAETDDAGDPPGDGEVFVVATVEVHSYRGSHAAGPGNDDFVFSLLDKKDKSFTPAEAVIGDPLDGTVKKKRTLSGTVVFAVPEAAADSARIRLKAAGANDGDQTVIWKPE